MNVEQVEVELGIVQDDILRFELRFVEKNCQYLKPRMESAGERYRQLLAEQRLLLKLRAIYMCRQEYKEASKGYKKCVMYKSCCRLCKGMK